LIKMQIPFFHRLYVRLWLAVVLAVVVLSLAVAWLMRVQAERIRAERHTELPARELMIRNKDGQLLGQATVRPTRVPGRGLEFELTLPENVRGREPIILGMRLRHADAAGGSMGAPPGALGPAWHPSRWLDPGARTWGLLLMLVMLAVAVALGSYPVVRRLTKRLEGLQRGVERLGAGDLRSRVDESGQDEAAFLAKRFNRAADQIEALMQSQKSLLANASHELRSPLARIRMGLELMESSPTPALKQELLRNMAELDALIDEILLASRLEAQASGALQAVREPVDMLALAAEEGARVGVALNWQGDPNAAVLPGDARLLRRLLRNLLENAQRHGGTDVALTLSAGDGALSIEVSDRGPGVPPEEREQIFEPFYRSRQASESSGGVGLGLALVRSVARQHVGSVQCLPREGGGARFVVRLPLLKKL
jgi:two-component system, OmpR family, sensor kinase